MMVLVVRLLMRHDGAMLAAGFTADVEFDVRYRCECGLQRVRSASGPDSLDEDTAYF